MSHTVDTFSKQVFGRAGALVIVAELPDSPLNYWREGQVVFSIAQGGFYTLAGGGWVQITDVKIVFDAYGGETRPDVTGSILWVSPVHPTNGITGDLWLNIA